MSKNEEETCLENVDDTTKCNGSQMVRAETISDVVTATALLQDKRRARIKSVGRPPTRDFLKETILQNSLSIDITDHETDDERTTNNYSKSDLHSLTKLVDEIKENPKIHSIVTTKTSTEKFSANWKNITLKKTTAAIKQSNLGEGTPPWLKEFRERKSHKLLVGSNEFLNNPERERYTVVEVNVSASKNKVKQNADKTNINDSKTDNLNINETVKLSENVVPTMRILERKSPPTVHLHTSNNDFENVQNSDDKLENEKNSDNDLESIKFQNLEDVVQKVNDFIAHSKTFQKKMHKDLQSLELSINDVFEKQIQELEKLTKNLLVSINKN